MTSFDDYRFCSTEPGPALPDGCYIGFSESDQGPGSFPQVWLDDMYNFVDYTQYPNPVINDKTQQIDWRMAFLHFLQDSESSTEDATF